MFITCNKSHKTLNNSALWTRCFAKINQLKSPAVFTYKSKSGEGIKFAIQLPESTRRCSDF
jgi:hypothetical protein